MGLLRRLLAALDGWQRRHRAAGVTWAVVKKFSDDQANLLVVALGWYGFTAIYPLLLVVVTIFGFIGARSLGAGIIDTLHQFPVIGSQFVAGRSTLHGSVAGLVLGLVGLAYGAQGVTQTAEQMMFRVWNLPQFARPGFLPRLGHSFAALTTIGLTFVANAFLAPFAGGHHHSLGFRVVVIAGMVVVNVAGYLATFRILTARESGVTLRQLVPGSVTGAIGFTALITVGAGLVQHQLQHSSATYGAFAAVIGLVTFLLLLAKISVYAAELNPVLARALFPRSLPTGDPTRAYDQVAHDLTQEERRRPDQRVGVGFGADAICMRPEFGDQTRWASRAAPSAGGPGRPLPGAAAHPFGR